MIYKHKKNTPTPFYKDQQTQKYQITAHNSYI